MKLRKLKKLQAQVTSLADTTLTLEAMYEIDKSIRELAKQIKYLWESVDELMEEKPK